MLKVALKILAWIIVVILAVVIMVPVALYIPAVQDFAKKIALEKVKESTGMDISADYLRLKFPLRVNLEGVGIVEATGDTMLRVKDLAVDVKVLPLLHGEIEVASLDGNDLYYRMGTPDSIMYLRANIQRAKIDATSVRLSSNDINIDYAEIDGARINLIMLDSVAPEKNDTTTSAPWHISARQIRLKDLEYRMQMLPTIDSLYAYVGSAHLDNGVVDMSNMKINASCLAVDSVAASYFTPTAEFIEEYTKLHPVATDSVETKTTDPWSITADSLRLTGTKAIYAVKGAEPQPGLDMNYIEATAIEIAIDSFYNRATDITVPLKNFRATERCGLTLMGHGTFAMDSGIMYARNFNISTYASEFSIDAAMGIGDLTSDMTLPLKLKAEASVALSDIEQVMPSMIKMMKAVPRNKPLNLQADIEGNTGLINVNEIRADLGNILHFFAEGEIANPMNFEKMSGLVTLNGSVASLNFMKPTLLEASIAKEVNLPPMRLNGKIDYAPGLISGNLGLYATGGKVALRGRWNQTYEGYKATLGVNKLNVAGFMPSLGVGHVTADMTVDGRGYNPLASKTAIDAQLKIDEVEYLGQTYSNLTLSALLKDGEAKGNMRSDNPDAKLDVDFDAEIEPDSVKWTLNGRIANLDLYAMKISTDSMRGSLGISSQGWMSPKTGSINASAEITDLNWMMGKSKLSTPSIEATLQTDSIFHATLVNGDLSVNFDAFCTMDTLLTRFTHMSDSLTKYINNRNIDMRGLQNVMPPMDMVLKAGTNNVASEYLKGSDMGFKSAKMTFHNDSLMALTANLMEIYSGSTRIDTLDFNASQHGKFLVYKGHVGNRPGTMDGFAVVNLTGYAANDKFAIMVNQRNIEDKVGFSIGMSAAVADSTVTLRLVPRKPIIGYKTWTLNSDNFVSFNFMNHHLDANLKLENEKSLVHLYTNHVPNDSNHQESVILDISKVQISDWLSISPFAPPVKGELSADMNFNWSEDLTKLTGRGMIDLNELFYGKERVGSFGLGVDLTTSKKGAITADVALMVDSIKVITARGALNDSTASNPFMLDFSMIKLPLRIVNPFLPADMARLSGTLNGQMDITGSLTEPIFNGFLDFDSTAVKVGMLGTSFKFSEEKIPVDSNIVRFNNFSIYGTNENPLNVTGTVNARRISDISFDLGMKAENMQLVNSTRPRGADVYGKANIDFVGSVKGNMSFMAIKAKVDVLPTTNVTYVVTSSVNGALSSQDNENLVKFINFNDTTQVIDSDSLVPNQLAMLLDANLIISEGSTINVDLPGGLSSLISDLPGGSNNKASIKSNGNLTFTMSPMSNGRLTGRLNINQGYVRYTPPIPFVSEKYFTFSDGSYIGFNGDMMNPILNLHAVDEMKANVTENGNSRLVNFDVSLAVTNTLENMKVVFDLSAPDDISVQNEISSMSPEQRANQAMNMLLYGEYTGPNTRANANLSVNPLYSFVESIANNWLANNVKGVDITLGMDQYNQTNDGVTSTAMTYSYQVSKSLMNDRIKIIVGGNYNTDADNDENLQQNLINDISFEYLMNASGTMLIKIFRHTGFESILEGEVTQTGVGFEYKKKMGSLREFFRSIRKRPTAVQVIPAPEIDDAMKPEKTELPVDKQQQAEK